MEENFIQLKKRNTLKFGIKDENGNAKRDENGNIVYIEFDMEDIELPLKYNKCEFLVRKAQQDLKFKLLAIQKREDVRTNKMILSKNEEDKAIAIKKFYEDMENAMDLFLGKDGVKKIFGDSRYLSMFDDLNEMLKPILPKLKVNVEDIANQIKSKYSSKKKDVLEDE